MPSATRKRFTVADLESVAFYEELAPALRITRDSVPVDAPAAALRLPGPWPAGGHATLPALLSPERALQMAETITAVVASGLPAVFAYVYDAFWEPAALLAPCMHEILGPCDLLADAWAWRIMPTRDGDGGGGWSAHRGRYARAKRAPAVINVWIALSDVGQADACIHVVPVDRDPAYLAHRLDDIDLGRPSAVPLPAATGTALMWDANALHWGGAMDRGASGPRISFSYTFAAREDRGSWEAVDLARLPFVRRLDLIATQIVVYGQREPIDADVHTWAEAVVALKREFQPRNYE